MEKTKRNILVTGCTGFLGRKLVAKLLEQGFGVKALVRNPSAFGKYIHEKSIPNSFNIEIFAGDLMHPENWEEKCFKGVDVVIHLAAEMDFFPSDSSKVYRTNVEGTKNVVNLCIQNNVKRFIYASSAVVLGSSPNGKPLDEESPVNPLYEYGKSKVQAEKVIKEMCKESALEYIILRPTGIYGPDDYFVIYELLQLINWGIIFFVPGSGKKFHSMWTYVDDVIDAFVQSIDKGKPNSTYVITGDDVLNVKQFLSILSESCGRAKPIIHLPLSVCKVAIAMMAPIFNLGKKRTFMFQLPTIDKMDEHFIFTNVKAKQELEWNPKINFKKGVEITADSYFKDGQLTKYQISPIAVIIIAMLLAYFVFKIVLS